MFSATKGGSPSGYQISRSVRLRSSASAYLNRTLTTPTNNKIWTWSAWVKKGRASGTGASAQTLFATGSASTDAGSTLIWFDTERLIVSGYSTNWLISSAVYRDPSAWYHILVAWDNSNATASNRIKIYVNGLEISYATDNRASLSTTATYGINQAVLHTLGAWSWNNGSFAQPQYFDGYLTEINFIDGQALTPSSFGETNAVTGVWQPIKYTGTCGTNGFYLNFSDNSAATAAAIGKDYSGNGNNWTPNNISVTAGVTYDSMLDVPTQWADGGNGRGNYSTMNPLDYIAAAFSGTASNGNLTISIPAPANSNGIASTIRVVSAAQPKFYIETTITALNTICSLGMISGTNANYRLRHTADITLAVNDVVMTAFDPATGNIWYGRNGTWLSSGNPAAGTNPFYTIPSTEIVGSAYAILATNGSTGTFTTSTTFGQRPFSYTPPTGFNALNTLNLPTPTILKGNQYFDVLTWSGTGGSSRTLTGLAFQPDFVWGKVRNTTYGHMLFDAVRGAGSLKELGTNVTGAEGYAASNQYGYLSAFNSDGFTVTAGTDGSIPNAYWNQSGNTYVGWQWKEGPTQGFDIVTYTGDGLANRTVAHSLGVTPAMVIVKTRSSVANWRVWHQSLSGNTSYLGLNQTAAVAISSTVFNGFSSTTFTVGTDPATNGSGVTLVAYCFAEVAGFSKFGSYTGNGSADGTFVYTGFRPRYIMIKRTDSTGDWNLIDTSRSTYNQTNNVLWANLSDADSAGQGTDILSNGFKLRSTGLVTNASGGTYIYAAFAENPLKFSLAR